MGWSQHQHDSVSNLLGSPASGEAYRRRVETTREKVSNLLGSPASGEFKEQKLLEGFIPFPIYWVPQRVGRWQVHLVYEQGEQTWFPIYWVPQRVGSSSGGSPKAGRRTVSNLLGSPASGETFSTDR